MRKESDTDLFNCIICKEDRHYFSIGSCDHRKVCNYCSLRSRILYKDKKCPICTTKLEEIFIFEANEQPTYSEIEKNIDDFYKDDDFGENGIYYASISAQEEAMKLKSYICPIKSCQDGAFDNLQTLCTHLNKVHKRYYCETCLKEGKRFLSEMPIYTYEALNEHTIYGEYSEKGNLVIPPHPICGFCNIKFYNDEHLFKHMNELHFICQLCRDKKNIIFYKELDQLLDHYRLLHYVCPYEECIADMFVVFDSEEKLNSHLITKHKCLDAHGKLTNFLFSADKNKSKTTQNKAYNIRDEFNFTQYVNELKERVKDYSNNLQNKKIYIKPNEEKNYNYGGRDKNRYNKNYNDNYYNYDDYNNQNYSQNQSQSYYQNYYQNPNVNSYAKKGKGQKYNDYPTQTQKSTNPKRSGDIEDYLNSDLFNEPQQNQNNMYQDSYLNQNQNPQNKRKKDKKNKFDKMSAPYEEKPHQDIKYTKEQIIIPETANKIPAKIDYSFIFNTFFKMIKEYIVQKIKLTNPKEEEFIVHRETIYQMIIIIDKLDNEKLLGLSSLNNFGFDLDIFKELKAIMTEGTFDENKLKKVLDKIEIKKLLYLYKYVGIAVKKVDGLFYKLGNLIFFHF